MLIPKQLAAVLAKSPKVVFALLSKKSVIFFRAPMPSIDPPKIIALIVKYIVHNIPFIPPEL